MILRRATLAVAILAVFAGGCGSRPTNAPSREGIPASPPPPVPAPTATPAPPGAPTVVFLGDSLTAGLGLGEEQAFPALVGEHLADAGLPVRVINAGVSGDTSAGGLRRLDWVLRSRPDLVVVGLGANDGLRGQPVAETERNLREILRRSRDAGALVLLLGMRLPRNLGPEYTTEFEAVYPRLARELDVLLVPFLLEGVAARPELNLDDGIHPNAAGHRIIAETVAPRVEELLRELPPPAGS